MLAHTADSPRVVWEVGTQSTNFHTRVEVAQIHLGNPAAAANELLNSMKPLHFEMFVPNAVSGLVEIYTASHLAGPFFGTGKNADQRPSEVTSGS